MIVRPRPNAFIMLFSWRGSILPQIAPQLLFVILLSIIVALFEHFHPHIFPELPIAAFSLIGLALSIFLGFRNNVCYDRWWEARKEWGALILHMRNFARESLLLHVDVRRRVLHRSIGFTQTLNARLRNQNQMGIAERWLPTQEQHDYAEHPNPSDYVLLCIQRDILECYKAGQLSDICYQQLSSRVANMAGTQAACERIRNTPVPFAYSLLIHRTAYLYSLLLPIGLGSTLGFLTPVIVGLLAYTFFGLDALGSELEQPFGILENDLPLDAMARAIEIDLLSSLGESNIPKPLQPVNFILQ
ncbi:bestrophin family protein [Aquirhabdus parva]|uniref:Bestrophin n=1 Tax=Aquirhabdus parva TaxID=2283318 RepID=A0A345P3X5_9GAMM|nr:bestrophin family ion channel [Aquirhabdus parva]AXI01984.1 bestrophin [Aquirhabdus parva]